MVQTYNPELIKGKNKLLFNNHVLIGPHWGAVGTTIFLWLGASVGLAIPVPWLINNILPLGIALLIPFLVCVLSAQTFLLLGWTMDPGIIPRQDHEPDNLRAQGEPDGNRRRRLPEEIDGKVYKKKYCETCRIWRPYRASHCSDCDNCVLMFDHLCPWFGGCIGKRNYRWFFWFVASIVMSCALLLAISICHIAILAGKVGGLGNALGDGATPGSVFCLVFAVVFLMFTGGLLPYHLWLGYRNLTTSEHQKGFTTSEFPDPERGLQSIRLRVWTPPPPSLVAMQPVPEISRPMAQDGKLGELS